MPLNELQAIKMHIVISYNVHLACIFFCAISFTKTQNLHFSKKSVKFVTIEPLKQAILKKITSISSCKISILHVIFFMIPCSRKR